VGRFVLAVRYLGRHLRGQGAEKGLLEMGLGPLGKMLPGLVYRQLAWAQAVHDLRVSWVFASAVWWR